MLENVVSYCNPFSQSYQRIIRDFPKLESSQKICAVVAPFFSLLIALSILGLGSIAVFRYLSDKFLYTNERSQPDSLSSPGLYLKRQCNCSEKIIKIGGTGSFNIIQRIEREAMICLNSLKNDCDMKIFVIVKSMNHKISYRKNTGNYESFDKEVILEKDQTETYLLDSYYSYFQLEMLTSSGSIAT